MSRRTKAAKRSKVLQAQKEKLVTQQQQLPQPAGAPISYADVFDITLSPYGASFRFGANGPVIQQGNQQVQQIEIGSRVAMSLEHLKALAFVVHREVLRHEAKMSTLISLPDQIVTQLLYPFPFQKDQNGNPIPVPPAVQEAYYNSMQPAALAEWRAFWKQEQPAGQGGSPNGATDDAAKALAKV